MYERVHRNFLFSDTGVEQMLVKQGQLHYNGYRRTSGPAPEEQRKGRILQEEDVEE